MTIFFNNEPLQLPQATMTLEELSKLKNIPSQGTAIAVNDRLVKREKWSVYQLNPMDNVVVITAAYGG